ncbi:restriction endonuclease subunit S [Clostridium sp. BSD9I1]|uniref:restriction endonuclease subunit S n=1 Tax=Clostridium sp. BSD9I1 TaxID=2003589 RepID=UPI0016467420|nr:restriction endonuclease subunit S [Clostridium sp. BSD9I1]
MAKKNMTLEEKLEEAIVKDAPYEVPENWTWSKIKFIGNVKGGKRLPKGNQLLDFKTDHPYIRVADFDSGTIDIAGLKYLDQESYNQIKNYTISSKDVYVSIAGSIGKVGIIPEGLDGANLTENAAKITDIAIISNKYLYYLLASDKLQRDMQDSSIATTQAKLALHKIADLVVPISPLKEQQRIVDRIESLFEKLDKAKELIEEARDGFEKRKAAILKKAFRGELTEKWRLEHPEIMSSEILIKKIEQEKEKLIEEKIIKRQKPLQKLTSDEAPYVVEDTWSWVRIDDIAIKVTDGEHSTPIRSENGYYLLSARNIRDGYICLKDVDYVQENEFRRISKRCDPAIGDILISCSGTIGRVALVDKNKSYVMVRSAAMIRPVQGLISPEYVSYALRSPNLQKQMIDKSKSTAQANLFLGEIKTLVIPLPPLDEQNEIVNILKKILEDESKIEELTQLEEQIELIKKSILAKAFRGELGTNCEEDESALELLKEILSKQ